MTDQGELSAGLPGDGLWVSVSELASLKGVTKQTISERVARLEADGQITTRKGQANTKLINLAEYDRAVGKTTNLAKQQAAVTARANRNEPAEEAGTPADPTFADGQRRKTHYEAALKALEFGERAGQLVAIDEVKTVIAEVAEEIAGPINQLPLRAEEITAAAARDGASAVRTILKDAAFNLLKAIAQALGRLDLKAKDDDAKGVEVEIVAPDDGRPA